MTLRDEAGGPDAAPLLVVVDPASSIHRRFVVAAGRPGGDYLAEKVGPKRSGPARRRAR
jgi:hypothetical protein